MDQEYTQLNLRTAPPPDTPSKVRNCPQPHVHVHRHMYTSTVTCTHSMSHVHIHRHMYTFTVTCTHSMSHVHIHRHMYTSTITTTISLTCTNMGNEVRNHVHSCPGSSFGLSNWRKIIGQSIYDVRHFTTSHSVCFHKWPCYLCHEVPAVTSFTSLFN